MAKGKETPQEGAGVEKLLSELNSKYGKGTVVGGKNIREHYEVVPTGSFNLDIALSCGGMPVGKLVEMFGPESSGKSTMALHFISEFQKAGKTVMLVDSEHSFDRLYATSIGVDVDSLLYTQPECMEDAYNIMETAIKSKVVSLIVFDSHTSSQPRKIVDGEVGDATIGLQARTNSIALAKQHALLDKYGVTVVAISQTRVNIGGYGDPNVTTGGLAYKFYSDIRLKVSKSADKLNSTNKTTVEVVKNKCGVPFGKAEFLINWGTGIDRQQEILDLAIDYKILQKGGSWISLEDGTKIQGDNQFKQMMLDNPGYSIELERKVMSKINEYEGKSEEAAA